MAAPFALGQVVATPGVLAAVGSAELFPLLRRHLSGDWGDLDAHDRKMNDDATRNGDRILSAYHVAGLTTERVKVYIITEADRSVTTFLLPEEY